MEHLEIYISLAGTVLSLLIATITFITKFIKSSKGKKIAENILEICSELLPLISKAEKLTNYTVKEKKRICYDFNSSICF